MPAHQFFAAVFMFIVLPYAATGLTASFACLARTTTEQSACTRPRWLDWFMYFILIAWPLYSPFGLLAVNGSEWMHQQGFFWFLATVVINVTIVFPLGLRMGQQWYAESCAKLEKARQ